MRNSTRYLFALTSLLIAAPACDVEQDLDFIDEDEPSTFRCGSPCLGSNSPYLGAIDITNLSIHPNTTSESPNEALSMHWTGARNGVSISNVMVSPQGQALVTLVGNPPAPIVGARFDLTVTDGNTTQTKKVWFADATSVPGAEDPDFLVTRYDIRTNIDPGPGHFYFGQSENDPWWSVCPTTNTAVLLAKTHADQFGDLGSVRQASTEFAIACDGHALAKGVTDLNVVPSGATARSYGYDHYSSLIQGWQAVFDGDSWTYLGAEVGVVDTVNDPPLFDTLGPIDLPTPMIGQYEWILESVYKDTGLADRGAQCKFTGHPLRPGGDHRNSSYDAPTAMIDGWSSLPECSGDLSQYGDVAFYSVSHMIEQGEGPG